MSANLKIRTMNTLLLGAALLTPLAAQDRNRNDRNDPRGADQSRVQSRVQAPTARQQPPAIDNRGGNQNRGYTAPNANSYRGDNRNSTPARGEFQRAPYAYRAPDRAHDGRGYDRNYRAGFAAPAYGHYVARYPGRAWSSAEDRAFRIFLAEQRLAYASWYDCDPYEQDLYWDWRDAHPDRILFSIGFGR